MTRRAHATVTATWQVRYSNAYCTVQVIRVLHCISDLTGSMCVNRTKFLSSAAYLVDLKADWSTEKLTR
jgi:hypothetical protein